MSGVRERARPARSRACLRRRQDRRQSARRPPRARRQPRTVVAFFARLAALFRSRAHPATHGCLLVNTIAEFAARDDRIRPAGADCRSRLRSGFAAALTQASQQGRIDPDTVEPRSSLLAALLMGVWLTVRIDADATIDLCRMIEREVGS